MPRNASGVYTLPSGNPVVPGTTIDAAWANDTMEDMANEITNSLSRTGAGGMLAPFRLADGTVTAPGVAWLNETNSGLYRSGAGSTWMSILGVNTVQFSTVGVTIPFGKALTAQGNASVSGTFGVTGATTLGSTLAVTGAITATGGVVGNVTGNVTAGSGSSTFNDVTITGSLDMTAGSSATITGLSTPTNASDAANKGYVDAQDALRLALTGGTMSGSINMGGYGIAGLATPSADTDAATKAYVDSVAQGIDAKASCKAATTGNISLGGLQIIDSVVCAAGDRVLVWQQTSAAQNGIYVVASGAWARASDANTWDELISAFTFVEQGTTNGSNGYICTITAGGTLGTTPVTWAQFSGAGQINAGTGMTKTGNTLNVNTASSSRIVVGADEIDLATTGVSAGTYKSVTIDQWGRVTSGTNPTTLAGYGITDAYTTTQVDTALALKLNLTGGTMSGAIAMGTNKITGLGDPTNPQDAATKSYIDTIFGSTSSAAASAAAAAASASAASTSATNAATSASNAATSATNAATSYTTFNNQYLGSKSSDPSTNNTGGALVAGNLYWNSTVNEMRVYNGSAWVAAYLPAAGYMDLTTNQTAAGIKTFSSNPVLSAGTANGVAYLNGSNALTTGSALTFNGTTLTATGNAIISDNSSNAALRITQTGAGNALLVEDSANPDATPFVVDASGSVIQGATTLPSGMVGPAFAIVGATAYGPQFQIRNKVADVSGSYFIQSKDRAGAVVVSGDALGNLQWSGYDGVNYIASARLTAEVDGTPGTNDMPGRLVFSTTADGAATPTERVRISSSGTVTFKNDYIETVVTANTSTAYTIDLANGTVQILTLTGNCTFTFPTAVAGKSFTLLLKQDGTGSRTVTWPAAVKWPGGTAPTITSTASKLDKYIFTSDGTNWYGSNAGQNYTV